MPTFNIGSLEVFYNKLIIVLLIAGLYFLATSSVQVNALRSISAPSDAETAAYNSSIVDLVVSLLIVLLMLVIMFVPSHYGIVNFLSQ